MKEDLLVISYVASCLVIWFDTEAFVEYVKLFRLNKYFDVEAYEKSSHLTGGVVTEYYEFLNLKYSNFFTKLISCPICVSFWLSLFFGGGIGDLKSFPLYFIGSIASYLLIKVMYK